MTSASLHAIAPRRAAPFVVIAALAFAACKGGADRRKTTGAVGAGGGDSAEAAVMESAGEVVIAAPSGRYAAAPVASAGTVSGTVSPSSPVSPAAPVATGRDAAVCGATVPDSSVAASGSGLGNVVVWLEGVRRGKPVPLERRIELESDHCLLTPRVQGAYAGGAVNVIGHDEFRQHLRFVAGGEQKPREAVLMGKDEQVIPTNNPLATPGLVIVRDLDHPWPRAYIAVFDHPYFAVTKPDGSFSIGQVPPGTYTLVAWHERAGRTEQKVTVTAGATATVNVKVEAK